MLLLNGSVKFYKLKNAIEHALNSNKILVINCYNYDNINKLFLSLKKLGAHWPASEGLSIRELPTKDFVYYSEDNHNKPFLSLTVNMHETKCLDNLVIRYTISYESFYDKLIETLKKDYITYDFD